MSQYQHFKLENISINSIIENISINLRKKGKRAMLIAAIGLAYPTSTAKLHQQPHC
jgi:hypothetical protein